MALAQQDRARVSALLLLFLLLVALIVGRSSGGHQRVTGQLRGRMLQPQFKASYQRAAAAWGGAANTDSGDGSEPLQSGGSKALLLHEGGETADRPCRTEAFPRQLPETAQQVQLLLGDARWQDSSQGGGRYGDRAGAPHQADAPSQVKDGRSSLQEEPSQPLQPTIDVVGERHSMHDAGCDAGAQCCQALLDMLQTFPHQSYRANTQAWR